MLPIKKMLAQTFLSNTVLYQVANADKVFLTFDDGPDEKSTPKVLDVLDRHGVKATFFMIGRSIRAREKLAAEVASRGHVIGNHSLTHPRMDRMSTRSMRLEIEGPDHIMTTLGPAYVPSLFRPPYGYVSVRMIRSVLQLERKMVMWTHDSFDFKFDTQGVIDSFRQRHPVAGNILLFHDDSAASAPALDVLIPRWKAAGLSFGVLGAPNKSLLWER